MDYQWKNFEIDPFSEDWGNNRDYQEGFNEVGNLSVEAKLADLLREYLQGDEESLSSNQAMVGSSQTSQISNEGYSNNLGYIDSGEIDRGPHTVVPPYTRGPTTTTSTSRELGILHVGEWQKVK